MGGEIMYIKQFSHMLVHGSAWKSFLTPMLSPEAYFDMFHTIYFCFRDMQSVFEISIFFKYVEQI